MSLLGKVQSDSSEDQASRFYDKTLAQSPIGLIRTHSRLKQMSLKKANVISTGLHLMTPLAAMGILMLLIFLLNINIWDWFKPKVEDKKDIEFVLVQDTQAKKPEKAKFKGEFNQEAGGQSDPNKPVEVTEKPAPLEKPQPVSPQRQTAQTKPSPPVPKMPPPTPPQQVAKPVEPVKPIEKPVIKPPDPPKLPPIKTATAFTPTIPVPTPTTQIKAPVPKMLTPQGPISLQKTSSPSGPVAIPSPAALASQSSGSTGSPKTASSAGGNIGNPEAGSGKIAGVSVQQADFGPYMSELKRRLMRNWHPPRGDSTKRVVLRFDIGRDGKLIALDVNHTSGEPLADEAAINAVRLSAPFKPLPPEFTGESVPILFTFDYTVYGSKTKNSAVMR